MRSEAFRVCDALFERPTAPSTRDVAALRAVGAFAVALRAILRITSTVQSSSEWQSNFAH